MPRTNMDIRAETLSDPCRQFRRILKSKQMDEENRKLFLNKDIAKWIGETEGSVSQKMDPKKKDKQFTFQNMRMIMEHVPFSRDEKAQIFE